MELSQQHPGKNHKEQEEALGVPKIGQTIIFMKRPATFRGVTPYDIVVAGEIFKIDEEGAVSFYEQGYDITQRTLTPKGAGDVSRAEESKWGRQEATFRPDSADFYAKNPRCLWGEETSLADKSRYYEILLNEAEIDLANHMARQENAKEGDFIISVRWQTGTNPSLEDIFVAQVTGVTDYARKVYTLQEIEVTQEAFRLKYLQDVADNRVISHSRPLNEPQPEETLHWRRSQDTCANFLAVFHGGNMIVVPKEEGEGELRKQYQEVAALHEGLIKAHDEGAINLRAQPQYAHLQYLIEAQKQEQVKAGRVEIGNDSGSEPSYSPKNTPQLPPRSRPRIHF